MRIRIKDSAIRETIFESLKEKFGPRWKDVQKKFDIPKATFEKYRSGKLRLPKELFLNLISSIDKKENEMFGKIEELPDNFGSVLGGKKSYKINKDKFELGRKKGMDSINLFRKVEYFNKDSFRELTLTPEICEVAGAFIGDGFFNCYKNKSYQIKFTGDSRKDVDYYNNFIIPYIKKVLPDAKPNLYLARNSNGMYISFYSKRLFSFLLYYLGFIPGKKTKTAFIPEIIEKSGDSFIHATIRGIFDTDGCVFLDKRKIYKNIYPRITLHTISERLHTQLVFHLSKNFKLYTRYDLNKKAYIIEIYGLNQIKKWMSLIGFSNKRHLDRLASVAQW